MEHFMPEIANDTLREIVTRLGVKFQPFNADIDDEIYTAVQKRRIHGITIALKNGDAVIRMKGDRAITENETFVLCHELMHWLGMTHGGKPCVQIDNLYRMFFRISPEEAIAEAGAFLLYRRITGRRFPRSPMSLVDPAADHLPDEFHNPLRYLVTPEKLDTPNPEIPRSTWTLVRREARNRLRIIYPRKEEENGPVKKAA